MQRVIDLTDEQLRQLEQLAAKNHRSVEEMVQIAVGDYIARRTVDWDEWGRQFDALVADVQAHMPPDVTPEEIEADITAAVAEVRAEMRREMEEARSREAAGAPAPVPAPAPTADAGGH